MTQKEISKLFYQRRIERGVCPACGGEKPEGRFYCDRCREKNNARHRENKKFCLSIGICPVCQKNKLFGSEKQCIDCREKAYKRRKELTPEQKEKHYAKVREYAHKRTAERIEKGICTKCGKRKATEGKRRCAICREKDNQYARLRYQPGEKERREKNNLCYHCGAELDTNTRSCSKCTAKFALIRRQRTSDNANHVWRKNNKAVFWEGVKNENQN